uniref:Transmembrane protein n=1 Tax=Hordeum vulgare subsp. vulgare TaxID=112509 RepID=A0A8I6X271_HORVV
MEQYERASVDPFEGQTEQRVEDPAPAAVLAGEVAGAKEAEQERVPETHDPVGAAASEVSKKQDVEEPSPEPNEVAAASADNKIEDLDAFENPMETCFANLSEFRSATADATLPYTSIRARSRKQAGPTKFIADGAGSEAPVLGASSSSAPARVAGTHEDFSSMIGAPGATVAIAHASPPNSSRRLPSRSRKQYSPKRFASAGASTSASAPAAGDPAPLGRGRKQPRPEHFIPEEAAAMAGAKARRGNIVLDRFLSSMARGSSPSDWARDITAEDAGEPERPRGVESFRIRDATRHAARACGLRAAINRLGASCGDVSPSSPAAQGEPAGSRGRRLYGILAVLGASLTLCVVSCVLFYIVGQSSEAAPSGEGQDK